MLDFFLTDIPGSKTFVGPQVADHHMVIADVPAPKVSTLQVICRGLDLKQARWKDLEKALEAADWSPLQAGSAEDAANYFMEVVWFLLCSHIPFKEVLLKKRSHPWMNERCESAIAAKTAAEGTTQHAAASRQCTGRSSRALRLAW